MKTSAAAIVLVLVFAFPRTSEAVIALADYAFNIDGAVSDIILGGDLVPAEADTSLFDDVTGLGTIKVTIAGVGPHYAGLFVDHEIDEATNTWFNEFGATSGTVAAGQSWEIDEPGFADPFGDIFDNFEDGMLDNSNGVPAGSENDVSMALAWSFFLTPGETAVASFLVAGAPPAGFHLSHTDPDSDETIYFSSALEIRDPGGPIIPEPTSLIMWLSLGLVGNVFLKRRRRRI